MDLEYVWEIQMYGTVWAVKKDDLYELVGIRTGEHNRVVI